MECKCKPYTVIYYDIVDGKEISEEVTVQNCTCTSELSYWDIEQKSCDDAAFTTEK